MVAIIFRKSPVNIINNNNFPDASNDNDDNPKIFISKNFNIDFLNPDTIIPRDFKNGNIRLKINFLNIFISAPAIKIK